MVLGMSSLSRKLRKPLEFGAQQVKEETGGEDKLITVSYEITWGFLERV